MKIENCQMHGQVDRFHKIHFNEWKTTGWIYLVQEEIDKKTDDLEARQCIARNVGTFVWCIQTKREATNWQSRSQSSKMPEDCVVFFFIDHDDEEFKSIMKNARRQWTFPMPAAMLCRLHRYPCRRTCCAVGEHKTKYACIVGADESVRIRMEGAPHRYHEDHVAGRGVNSLSHYNLVRKFILILCLKQWKYQMLRQQWRKNGKN